MQGQAALSPGPSLQDKSHLILLRKPSASGLLMQPSPNRKLYKTLGIGLATAHIAAGKLLSCVQLLVIQERPTKESL